MGGWCRQRESCADFHERGPVVAERLCERGKEEPRRLVRFDAWLAGCSAEQQARFEAAQQRLDAHPVTDDQLPPALRGGALEVF